MAVVEIFYPSYEELLFTNVVFTWTKETIRNAETCLHKYKLVYVGLVRWRSGQRHLPCKLDDLSSVPGAHGGGREPPMKVGL